MKEKEVEEKVLDLFWKNGEIGYYLLYKQLSGQEEPLGK